MNIRPATAADCTRLSAIDAADNPHPWTAGQFESSLNSKNGHILVCTDANATIQGFIVWHSLPDESELHLIAVSPEYRRRGIAGRLLSHWFDNTPARRLLLEVRAGNHPAQALYRKHGFQNIGLRKNYYTQTDGQREDAVIMEKTC